MIKKIKIHEIILRIAAVLLILVLFTFGMISGWYARYITTESGGDEARVAKFKVVETGELLTENLEIDIVPGGEQEITVTVENASEVAISYTIDADNPYHNLPLGFKVRSGETTQLAPFEAYMEPGETKTYVLVVFWDSTERDISHSGKVDIIEVYARASQLD